MALERRERAWSNSDELLARAVEMLGLVATGGRVYLKKPPEPIRRPWEPAKKKGLSAVGFIRAMAGGRRGRG